MKYGERELEKGEKVKIFTGISQDFLGIGEYKGDETGSPCFVLNGNEVFGYECWWIPELEARIIEEFVEEGKKEKMNEEEEKEEEEVMEGIIEKITTMPVSRVKRLKEVLEEMKKLKEQGKTELDNEMISLFLEFKSLIGGGK